MTYLTRIKMGKNMMLGSWGTFYDLFFILTVKDLKAHTKEVVCSN
jgi:hypothetical protein